MGKDFSTSGHPITDTQWAAPGGHLSNAGSHGEIGDG